MVHNCMCYKGVANPAAQVARLGLRVNRMMFKVRKEQREGVE